MQRMATSLRAWPAALALAVGAVGVLGSMPASAQVRAALVQSVDEPARNPYQETLFNVPCRATAICTFDFAAVPAGKRLVVTHISGYVDTANGTMPNSFLQSNFGGPAYATVPIIAARGPLGALGTRYIINQSVLAYFGPGENPRGSYQGLLGEVMSGGATMMLTGYFINLP